MFRSLRHRNFRLFFLGQFISLCGSWVQGTALSWLVYRLTRDPFMLGLVNFTTQFPVFVLGFHAGQVVDRLNHRRLVLFMQSFAMLQASLLAFLTLTGRVQTWHVFALAFMLGLVYCFEIPARQVLIGELVPIEDRHNAIALNSTIVNGSRILAPALAGLAIGWVGEGWCFAVNALSYVAVLAGLLLMRDVRQAPAAPAGSAWQEIRNGLAYVVERPALRSSLVLLTVFSVAGLPVYVLLPVFSGEILGAGARGFGLLSSLAGLGATCGALRLAGRSDSRGLSAVIPACLLIFAAGLLGLAASRRFYVSGLLMWLVGFAAIQIIAGINTLLQELSSDRFRGRVMGFYAMIFIGLSPVGSFFFGGLAGRVGVRVTVAAQAAVLLAAGALYWRRFPAMMAEAAPAPGSLGPEHPGPFAGSGTVGGP